MLAVMLGVLGPRRPVSVVVAVLVLATCCVVAAPRAGAQGNSFTFHGRGWGHGLGMAQWGAHGLAARGWDAGRILRHYYRGTTVESKQTPSEIRVGLLQDRTEVIVEGGRFDLHDAAGRKRATGGSGEHWRVVPNGSRLEVFAPGKTSPAFSTGVPVTIRYEPHNSSVKLPQTGYHYKRGRIDIDIDGGTGRARAILMVGFEEYLYGLGEMPSSWPMEALKTQAIAGRTYALEKVNRLGQNRSGCNCGLYASTLDQAYVGTSHEVGRWVQAVDATRGRVATRGGAPIQAFYSSSSGGFTEHNENVFGGSPIPYLRGTCDPGDHTGSNPHSNWTVTMSAAQVEQRLRNGGHDVGGVRRITFLDPRGVSGRVLGSSNGGVRIDGVLRSVTLSGSRFRSLMGLKSTLIFHLIYGGIRERYDELSCAPGLPRNNEYTWRDLGGEARGRAQDFTTGRLVWNPSTNRVTFTYGGILARYDALRAAGTDLGLPTTDERTVPRGRATFFENGHIYWSPRTGAHVTYGGILQHYLATGGPGKWGVPTTDERSVPNGRASYFEFSRVYWSPRTGAHVTYGGILKKYKDTGGPAKWGMPKSDERSVPGGRLSDFEHSHVYWSPAHGARVVYGGILQRYLELGGPGGRLGMPTSDEHDIPGGRRTTFQHGSISWDRASGRITVG